MKTTERITTLRARHHAALTSLHATPETADGLNMSRNRRRWTTERDASDAQWLLAAATVALVLIFVAVLHCWRAETGAKQKDRPMRVLVSLRPELPTGYTRLEE